MSQRRQRLYRRLDRAERAAIERGLDKNRPGKGSRVESVPELTVRQVKESMRDAGIPVRL